MTTDHVPTTPAGTSKISSEEPGIEGVAARRFGSINVRLNVIDGGAASPWYYSPVLCIRDNHSIPSIQKRILPQHHALCE